MSSSNTRPIPLQRSHFLACSCFSLIAASRCAAITFFCASCTAHPQRILSVKSRYQHIRTNASQKKLDMISYKIVVLSHLSLTCSAVCSSLLCFSKVPT